MKQKIFFSILACVGICFISNEATCETKSSLIHSKIFQEVSDTTKEEEVKPFLTRLNQGRKITKEREVLLEIRPRMDPKLVAEMKIGFDESLKNTDWQLFSPRTNISLPGGDGEKIIYIQLKDVAGNESPIENNRIVYDTQPPSNCRVIINDGEDVTNNKFMKVRLKLHAEDVFKMQISNSLSFEDVEWEKYTDRRNWILSPEGDGVRIVYARFSDVVENISETVSDSIRVDKEPPTGNVVINNDDRFTNFREIELEITSPYEDLSAIRVIGGKSEVMPIKSPIPEETPFRTSWTLDTLEGKKFVRVFFRDRAGNVSPEPAFDEIILDTKAPEKPFLYINNGARFTTNEQGQVELNIKTRETPVGYTVIVSNDPEFSAPETFKYQSVVPNWQLNAEEDGFKTVYAKFRDLAGNESEVGSASTTLDRSAPVVKKFVINNNEEWSNKPVVQLDIKAEGANFMQISNTGEFSGESRWQPYAEKIEEWVLVGEETEQVVYARFRDMAGNLTEVVSDTIKIDSQPPAGKITINKGAEVTIDRNVTINFIYNSAASEMVIADNPAFEGAEWQEAKQEIEGWQVSEGDGVKFVYAKFRDESGLESPPVRDRIILDQTPPQNPRIVINKDANYVTDPEAKVRILLSAAGAESMRISQNKDFFEVPWENYQVAKEFTLEGEDGEKTVYAQFRDQNGNVSKMVSDEIILDRQPPTPRLVVINEGDEWTNHPEKLVNIKINADDAEMMMISQDLTFDSSKWEKYKTQLTDFQLKGEDGKKTLYVVFRDKAGNVSKPISDSINLKRSF